MIEELTDRYEDLGRRAHDVRGYLDPAHLQKSLQEIEQKLSQPDVWSDPTRGERLARERGRIRDELDLIQKLLDREEEVKTLLEWAREGENVAADLAQHLDQWEEEVESAELQKLLGGEHDAANAIVSIHPGAGGTESQDWAEMLLRMYLRWAERRDFKTEMIDYQEGEEAGIKSATFTVSGPFAYGYLRAEVGVHRLVRISPFDAAKRRHTSFASVFVFPEIDEDVNVEINEKDLRIDTYRSSGSGGQHVNVTDSAVRITHLPTGIVVQCQNERSQHRNKDVAMKVLRARLYDLKLREQQEKVERMHEGKKEIAWGSQIRSYVFQPYRLVKDHRTKVEAGDVDRVMNGDIDAFIKAFLLSR
ncbi:MAG TPA: peptide chain release factor 2 [Vicinamibacteria bacterium]|nr:peptide chain release factor 2 [Vicinamibacteria bacterium]